MRRLVLPLFVALAVLAAIGRRVVRRTRQAHRPADPAFMLAMHNAFRRDLARLQAAAQTNGGTSLSDHAGWQLLRRELEFHHGAEDEDLWPLLRDHVSDPVELDAISTMVEQHGRIEPALDAVEIAGPMRSPSALNALRTLVDDHLIDEERMVLPLVSAYLSDAEWHEFMYAERAKRRPRERVQFLTWILDGASEADRAAVLSELPPPGRLVYRLILGPRYSRRGPWAQPDERDGSWDRGLRDTGPSAIRSVSA